MKKKLSRKSYEKSPTCDGSFRRFLGVRHLTAVWHLTAQEGRAVGNFQKGGLAMKKSFNNRVAVNSRLVIAISIAISVLLIVIKAVYH